MLTDNEKAKAVRDYARQTVGSENYTRHPLVRRLVYTDGVGFMASTCGAHWLIDAVASYYFADKKVRAEDFATWELRPHGAQGVQLVCTDGGKDGNDPRTIVTQEIESTDFPAELLPFRMFCESSELEPGTIGWVLMLPEER